MAKNNNVVNDTRYADLRPNIALHALPPSNRPMGNKFNAETINPANPIRNNGWMGIGCDSGNVMTFGANTLVNDPTRKLVLSNATGTVARVDMSAADV
mmetsp:Transcript_3061/g.3512  ORF Transcript_3061/g.3512 Transcript_3061/m.3512 type:complete len:98 (-) Transcript_3061:537-830(-)